MEAAMLAITDAVSFDTVITGLGVVFGAAVLVHITLKGGSMLTRAIRGA